MAKKVYKIPQSLALGWLDVEIAMKGDNGVGLYPMALRNILAIVASAIGCLWCVLNTGVKAGGPVLIVLFVIFWIMLSMLLLRPEKSGGMAIQRIPALINYIPRSARHVLTRSNRLANQFYTIANIDEIDEERGLIRFADGWVGFAYRVVGTGSVLLFEEDRDAILDRVDSFYRNMKTDYEYIFMTARESQNIRAQVEAMDRRIAYLESMNAPGNDELIALLRSKRTYLTDEVGGTFRSIHQYLVLRAPSEELLTLGRNMLQAEVENSTLMFKRCTALFDEDLHAMFASVYKGKESL